MEVVVLIDLLPATRHCVYVYSFGATSAGSLAVHHHPEQSDLLAVMGPDCARLHSARMTERSIAPVWKVV